MAVYIDDAEHAYGRMVMCHMIADSTEELLRMVDRIGVARKWIQDAGTYREHFDICRTKRTQAIVNGALLVTRRELGRRIISKRTDPQPPSEDRG